MQISSQNQVLTFDAPPVDRREVLRYARARADGGAVDALLTACLAEAEPLLTYRVLCRRLDITVTPDGVGTAELFFASRQLAERMTDCAQAVLFAATVGLPLDRLIARYQRTDPPRALLLNALGAERVEALCDAFCAALAADAVCTQRFSPGYGDLPLETQQTVFRLLDGKRIGLALQDSMLMSPSKSVTAFVGLKTGENE
ncbi:MAG: Vitamin B12 dependent methionine synthase activation subunit [Clostridia bacterium]|nr:Vitamin B12 dependent methionine synthase activation subunit [Clostridia bacterium]